MKHLIGGICRRFARTGAPVGSAPAGLRQERAPHLTDDEIRDIRDTIEAWAASVAAGDYPKWLSHFAEDAVLMPPGHPSVKGHRAIEAFVRQKVGPLSSFTFTDWQFEGACGLAVVTSRFVAGALDDKHQVVLRRQADGRWQIKTVIYNANAES